MLICRMEYDTDMTPEDSVKQIITLAEHFLLLIITCLCMLLLLGSLCLLVFYFAVKYKMWTNCLLHTSKAEFDKVTRS